MAERDSPYPSRPEAQTKSDTRTASPGPDENTRDAAADTDATSAPDRTMGSMLRGGVRSAGDTGSEVVGMARSTASNALTATGQVAIGVVAVTRDVAKEAIVATEDVGSGLVMATKNVAQHVIGGVHDVGEDLIVVATELGSDAGQLATNAVRGTVGAVADVLLTAVSGIKQVATAALPAREGRPAPRAFTPPPPPRGREAKQGAAAESEAGAARPAESAPA
jgi:hypothetical protein